MFALLHTVRTFLATGFRCNWNLTDAFVRGIYDACVGSNIDYMEVGYLTSESGAAEAGITAAEYGPAFSLGLPAALFGAFLVPFHCFSLPCL